MINFIFEIKDLQCQDSTFRINDFNAKVEDFGNINTTTETPYYGCPGLCFTKKRVRNSILKKYGISKEEYYYIANYLEKRYKYSCCSFCQ